MLDYLKEMNELTLTPDGTDLSARIASYELAFRMQQHAPEAVDIRRETDETRALYGLDDAQSNEFGTRCLLARRLVERGVRFVQLFSGGGPVSWQWDAHDNVVENHEKMCARDRQADCRPPEGPEAKRGLLDETLVVWGSEFGADPGHRRAAKAATTTRRLLHLDGGRRHQGRNSYGATDEIGYKAVRTASTLATFMRRSCTSSAWITAS